jgi:hypothetical protein
MDPIREVMSTVVTAPPDLNLSSLVWEEYSKAGIAASPPRTYFWITELVNPTQTYWHRVTSNVRRSQELVNRLELGRQRHRIAGYWFGRLPNFQIDEANLNGYYVGVPDVVGKIDFLIGDRFLEFKTKEAPDISEADVATKYLNDLEQLAFYAALSVDEPTKNILCFLGRGKPDTANLRVFDVEVTNHAKLREELQTRIDWLRAKIRDHDPSGLPRCFYYSDSGLCEFRALPCTCDKAGSSVLGNVSRWVRINRNPTLEATFSPLRTPDRPPDGVWTIRDLMFPRQWYHAYWDYETSDSYQPYASTPERDGAISFLDTCIWKAGLKAANAERNAAHLAGDASVPSGKRYLRVNVLGSGPGTVVVPYIVRYSDRIRSPPRPVDYHLAEIALLCGRAGMTAGVVALATPKAPKPAMLYLVRFDRARLREFYEAAKDQLRTSIAKGDPTPLPRCTFIDSCPFGGCACKAENGGLPPASS